MGSCFWPLTSASRGDSRISSSSRKRVYNFVAREDRSNDVATKLQLTSFSLTPRLGASGTLKYSGRSQGGRQPEVKCSILGTN